jgi:hypothetical protein
MKAMRKKFLATGMGLLAVAMVANDASATRFTETADFQLSRVDFPVLIPPPLTALELSGDVDGGGLYTNTFAPTGVGSDVFIRTIGINKVVSFSNGSGDVKSPIPGDGSNEAYVIFALNGVATPTSPTTANAVFSAGRAIVVAINDSVGPFDEKNPTTWQFGLNPGNVLAVYDLAPQEAVQQGINGDTIAIPGGISAGETNFSAINTGSTALTQGIFVFDYVGNGAALPVIPDFQVNQPVLTGLPDTEGLVVFTQQTNPNQNGVYDGPGGADEAVLNAIYSALLPGLVFADDGTLVPGFSNYVIGGLGDSYHEFGFSANPTSQAAIPEPATLTLGVMGLAGIMLRRRRLA